MGVAPAHRIFTTPVSAVYPQYIAKVQKKGRSAAEVDEVICWLTGFDQLTLQQLIREGRTFSEFFDLATLNPNVYLITGSVCGVRVQDVQDPLMQKIRYLDKLVDELAKGHPLAKILRGEVSL